MMFCFAALFCASLTSLAPPPTASPPAPAPPSNSAMTEAFEDGQLTEALRLARLALAANPNAPEPTARLVETFALLRMGRAADGAKGLEALRASGPDLGTYAFHLLSRTAAAQRSCGVAALNAGHIANDSVFAASSWAQVARCALSSKNLQQAHDALDRADATAITDGQKAEVELLAGRLAELSANLLEARDHYRGILVDYPLGPAAREAGSRLAELKRHGVAVRALEPDELLPRAESELTSFHPQTARRTYKSVVAQSKKMHREDLADQAELGLVELDIVDQQYSRALGRLQPLLKKGHNDAARGKAMYLEADLLARLNRITDALLTYQTMQVQLPKDPYTLLGSLTAAQLAYQIGDLLRARGFAQWLINQPVSADETPLPISFVRDDGARGDPPSPRGLYDNALWQLAWFALRDPAVPREVADSYLAQIATDGPWAETALYWRARLALDVGDLDGAVVFAQLLTDVAPTSAYAMFISDALQRTDPTCDVRFAIPDADRNDTATLPAAPPLDLKAALVLFQHGLQSEARRLLKLMPVQSLSDADRLVAAYLYRRCGEIHRAAMLTRRDMEGSGPVQDPAVINLAYPRPFEALVQDAAADYNVPLELIYAIMREESSFNPLAVSPRQAWGLMQMIGPTARRLAKQIDLQRFSNRKLFDPSIAIRLGTLYLDSLLTELHGNLPAAIASYQAGERAVTRWLKTREHMRTDEFIEDIPYASTRIYVKKVLSSYAVYRLLSGKRPEGAVESPPQVN